MKTDKKVSLVLVAVLSGCAPTPDLGELSTPTKIEELESSKSLQAPSSQWPKKEWWKNYNDPQLNTLIEEGLNNSPSLAQAQARLTQAIGLSTAQGGSLYPAVSTAASVQGKKQTYFNGMPKPYVLKGTHYNSLATVDFSYELDFFHKNKSALEQAISLEEASALDLEQAKLMVSISIAKTYSDLAKLYKHQEAALEALTVRQKTADLFRLRTEKGLENEGTLEQALSSLETAKADLNSLEESIKLTKIQLSVLMGKGPDRSLSILKPTVIDQEFGLPQEISSELLLRRPDLAAAIKRTRAALLGIDAAKASFYPSVNLLFTAGRSTIDAGDFFKSGAGIASFGPSFTLPIFNTKALQGNLIQARSAYDLAVANYNEVLIKALNDVASIITKHQQLALRVKNIESAYESSLKAYEVINARYKAGVTNYLEVLRAEDSLIITRRALADIKSQAFALDVDLVQALGGGFVLEKQ